MPTGACCSKCIASSGLTDLGRDGAYGRVVKVELLHKLHDERKYDSLDALREGIAQDTSDAQAWFAEPGRA